MNNETIMENSSYISYEVDGTKFIFQTSDSWNELDPQKLDATNEKNFIDIVEDAEMEKDDSAVSLVCLDGQVYAFKNEELQQLYFSQLINQNEFETEALLPKDINVEETHYIPNEEVLIRDMNEHEEKLKTESDQINKNYIIDKDNVNENDFVEVVTAFKCKMCPYTTQDRVQLFEHFQDMHVNPTLNSMGKKEKRKNLDDVKLVYMCGECSNCFSSLNDCKDHMIKDHRLMDTQATKSVNDQTIDNIEVQELLIGHNVDRLGCNNIKRQVKLPKALSSEYMLNRKSMDIREKNLKCSYRGCLYKFSTEEVMQQHASCHIDSQSPTLFKCNVCKDAKFNKWRPCSLHLWKQHQIDIDLLTCKICKAYKTATMVKLLTHMRVHSETREYECPECGKCFKQSNQLRNHRIMHLDRKSTEFPRWYTSKTCEMCGKIYSDSKCLKIHIQSVHSKLRPYVCNVCGHSSAKKAMLQMHLRQHTGDKPFNCELCEYKTGDHNSLRRHVMRHTGVRPYKCPHCPYSAIQSSSYKNHLKSKHPLLSGLFTCELCSFKTIKKDSYMQHVTDHEKGLIKACTQKKDNENVEVFPGNIAAAQLIYSCLGAFSKVGKALEANLMSSSTSADGTSQTITIQIPSKHLEDSLPTRETILKSSAEIEQEDDETMHCFLKIPREEEENIDTGGITIPAEPDESSGITVNVET
ncbi:zinc finger protein 892-like [Prorops nasuta]|uniref:zinc finger protein 892-like n=1 Tax=Prorops nasuta TaxID=863751 RepID=UPI0034D00280